ncbi:unnamed protein product [Vitrella brassicaformis CCMP3155]|uniref:Tyrosine-protein kinase ephrin type A/B receptor-like domain-containing protein n=7 Tax=Vitrella brassicaformis TaxID=1169539 RepID=A0A0G4F5F7_VITBC|nr:unnamed protein product [Vitrella brassicaformis CCMP3155]|eukprot:CEM07572.1 unnamed protein product [Vitrella brassicaformis CCMP3155]
MGLFCGYLAPLVFVVGLLSTCIGGDGRSLSNIPVYEGGYWCRVRSPPLGFPFPSPARPGRRALQSSPGDRKFDFLDSFAFLEGFGISRSSLTPIQTCEACELDRDLLLSEPVAQTYGLGGDDLPPANASVCGLPYVACLEWRDEMYAANSTQQGYALVWATRRIDPPRKAVQFPSEVVVQLTRVVVVFSYRWPFYGSLDPVINTRPDGVGENGLGRLAVLYMFGASVKGTFGEALTRLTNLRTLRLFESSIEGGYWCRVRSPPLGFPFPSPARPGRRALQSSPGDRKFDFLDSFAFLEGFGISRSSLTPIQTCEACELDRDLLLSEPVAQTYGLGGDDLPPANASVCGLPYVACLEWRDEMYAANSTQQGYALVWATRRIDPPRKAVQFPSEVVVQLTRVVVVFSYRWPFYGSLDPVINTRPDGVGENGLGRLAVLYMFGASVKGTFGEALTRLTNLRTLRLFESSIEGPLPSDIDRLTKLCILDLERNPIGGAIPPSLSKLGELRRLSLAQNKLTGAIPEDIGDCNKLEQLLLENNQLDGPLPPSLGQTSLQQLYLTNNKLTGSLPDIWSDLGSTLEQVDLSSNRFDGDIPLSMWVGAQILWDLNLANNQLVGSLPSFSTVNSSLRHLDLSDNELTGRLPDDIDALTSLERLLLHGNRLSGPLPESVASLAQLRQIDLSRNRLAGPIPSAWGYSAGFNATIEEINLSHNELTALPDTLPNATLRVFNAEHNNLTGGFPSTWRQLPSLQRLLLRHNRLSGWMPWGRQPDQFFNEDGSFDLSYCCANCTDTAFTSPLEWKNLEEIDVSENPISVPVHHMLRSLSRSAGLVTVRAAGCGLTGVVRETSLVYVRGIDGGPEDEDCVAIMGFRSLQQVDLSRNDIHGLKVRLNIDIGDFPGFVNWNLTSNNITTLEPPGYWLQRPDFSFKDNPSLHTVVQKPIVVKHGNNNSTTSTDDDSNNTTTTSTTNGNTTSSSSYLLGCRAIESLKQQALEAEEDTEEGEGEGEGEGEAEGGEEAEEDTEADGGDSTTTEGGDAQMPQIEADAVYVDPAGWRGVGETYECTGLCEPSEVDPSLNVTAMCRCKQGYGGVGQDCHLCGDNRYSTVDPFQPYSTRECRNCPPGTVTLPTERIHTSIRSCRCEAGRYEIAPSVCEVCPKDTYNPHIAGAGRTACRQCPPNRVTFTDGAKSPDQCVCKTGFYDPTPVMATNTTPTSSSSSTSDGTRVSPGNDTICRQCGEGLECETDGLDVATLGLRPGYWRQTQASLNVRKCPLLRSCQGFPSRPRTGTRADSSRLLQEAVDGEEDWEPSMYCSEGFEGPLCAVCKPGYARMAQTCILCTKRFTAGQGALFGVALTLLLIVACKLLYDILIHRPRALRRDRSTQHVDEELHLKRGRWVYLYRFIRPKAQILIVFLQILAAFPDLDTSLPAAARQLASALSILNIDWERAFRLGCHANILADLPDRQTATNAYVFRMLLISLTPVVVVAFAAALLAAKAALVGWARARRGEGEKEWRRRWIDPKVWREEMSRLVPVSIIVLHFCYFAVAMVVLRYFSCDGDFDDGSRYLMADYSTSCQSNEYYGMLGFASVMLVVLVIGTPAYFTAILFPIRRDLSPLTSTATTPDLTVAITFAADNTSNTGTGNNNSSKPPLPPPTPRAPISPHHLNTHTPTPTHGTAPGVTLPRTAAMLKLPCSPPSSHRNGENDMYKDPERRSPRSPPRKVHFDPPKSPQLDVGGELKVSISVPAAVHTHRAKEGENENDGGEDGCMEQRLDVKPPPPGPQLEVAVDRVDRLHTVQLVEEWALAAAVGAELDRRQVKYGVRLGESHPHGTLLEDLDDMMQEGEREGEGDGAQGDGKPQANRAISIPTGPGGDFYDIHNRSTGNSNSNDNNSSSDNNKHASRRQTFLELIPPKDIDLLTTLGDSADEKGWVMGLLGGFGINGHKGGGGGVVAGKALSEEEVKEMVGGAVERWGKQPLKHGVLMELMAKQNAWRELVNRCKQQGEGIPMFYLTMGLHAKFVPRYFWWEVFGLFIRFMLAVVLVTPPPWQLLLACSVTSLYLGTMLAYRPYLDRSNTVLATVCAASLLGLYLWTAFSQLHAEVIQDPQNEWWTTTIFVLLMCCPLVTFAICCGAAFCPDLTGERFRHFLLNQPFSMEDLCAKVSFIDPLLGDDDLDDIFDDLTRSMGVTPPPPPPLDTTKTPDNQQPAFLPPNDTHSSSCPFPSEMTVPAPTPTNKQTPSMMRQKLRARYAVMAAARELYRTRTQSRLERSKTGVSTASEASRGAHGRPHKSRSSHALERRRRRMLARRGADTPTMETDSTSCDVSPAVLDPRLPSPHHNRHGGPSSKRDRAPVVTFSLPGESGKGPQPQPHAHTPQHLVQATTSTPTMRPSWKKKQQQQQHEKPPVPVSPVSAPGVVVSTPHRHRKVPLFRPVRLFGQSHTENVVARLGIILPTATRKWGGGLKWGSTTDGGQTPPISPAAAAAAAGASAPLQPSSSSSAAPNPPPISLLGHATSDMLPLMQPRLNLADRSVVSKYDLAMPDSSPTQTYVDLVQAHHETTDLPPDPEADPTPVPLPPRVPVAPSPPFNNRPFASYLPLKTGPGTPMARLANMAQVQTPKTGLSPSHSQIVSVAGDIFLTPSATPGATPRAIGLGPLSRVDSGAGVCLDGDGEVTVRRLGTLGRLPPALPENNDGEDADSDKSGDNNNNNDSNNAERAEGGGGGGGGEGDATTKLRHSSSSAIFPSSPFLSALGTHSPSSASLSGRERRKAKELMARRSKSFAGEPTSLPAEALKSAVYRYQEQFGVSSPAASGLLSVPTGGRDDERSILSGEVGECNEGVA